MYLFGQAAEGAQPAGGMLGMLFPFILIFVIFYFIIIMPAKKKQKAHQAMLGEIKGGERIVTSGGIFGRVTRVLEDRYEIEVANNTRIQISKSSVANLVDVAGAGSEGKEK